MRRRSGQSGRVYAGGQRTRIVRSAVVARRRPRQARGESGLCFDGARGAGAGERRKIPAISENEDQIIAEFTQRFYDTQLFWDKYAGGKFAEYLFKAKEFVGAGKAVDADRAVQLLAGSAVVYRRGP